jgi:hypothetical protein
MLPSFSKQGRRRPYESNNPLCQQIPLTAFKNRSEKRMMTPHHPTFSPAQAT